MNDLLNTPLAPIDKEALISLYNYHLNRVQRGIASMDEEKFIEAIQTELWNRRQFEYKRLGV